MKIGYDAKRAFNNRSGLGNYSRDIIRAVANFGRDEIFLFTPRKDPDLFDIKGVNIIGPQKPVDKLLKSYWRSFSLAEEIEKLELDLFHGLSNEIPYGIKKPTKTVITIHDLIFKRFPEWYNYFDREIYDRKVKYGVEHSDVIIAISEQTKRDLISFYDVSSKKIKVVYQTCNDVFKKKPARSLIRKVEDKYELPDGFLLYVGTVEPRKNAFNIVKAVHKYNIDFPLILIGRETNYAKEIKKYINDNGLDQRIIMFHEVSTEELPVFYRKARVFIYPSAFEGFGIPIIEALYSGTPVITGKGGCFSEPGGKHSVYIDPSNVDELAESIIVLLKNEKKREKMSKEGLKYVQRFNTDRILEELYQVYTSLK
jgi:glycosyltransferase involved in cell wall biosynthesis